MLCKINTPALIIFDSFIIYCTQNISNINRICFSIFKSKIRSLWFTFTCIENYFFVCCSCSICINIIFWICQLNTWPCSISNSSFSFAIPAICIHFCPTRICVIKINSVCWFWIWFYRVRWIYNCKFICFKSPSENIFTCNIRCNLTIIIHPTRECPIRRIITCHGTCISKPSTFFYNFQFILFSIKR